MASGYEKADCGINPNTGWDAPTARPSKVAPAIVWTAMMTAWLFTSPLGAAIRHAIDL